MIEENEVPTEDLKEGALLATGVYSEERTRRRREIVLELDKKIAFNNYLHLHDDGSEKARDVLP